MFDTNTLVRPATSCTVCATLAEGDVPRLVVVTFSVTRLPWVASVGPLSVVAMSVTGVTTVLRLCESLAVKPFWLAPVVVVAVVVALYTPGVLGRV